MERDISAVISGSFKFKPEIDATREILESTGIIVLEPSKGWVAMPASELIILGKIGQIRPLPSEKNLTTFQIEDRFLRALDSAAFVYLMNADGYIGLSTAFELGYALAKQKPVYAWSSLDFDAMEVDDIQMRLFIVCSMIILPPEDVAAHYLSKIDSGASTL